MKKVIKLTEAQLVRIINDVIKEQNVIKKQAPKSAPVLKLSSKIDIIGNGQTAHGNIILHKNKKVLVVTTELGNKQGMYVKTNLPVDTNINDDKQGFMFELSKDGKRMFGYNDKTNKKIEIFPL